MHSLRTQLAALLLAVAFVLSWAHCTLDLGCADEVSGPALCQMCWCHSPALSDAKPVLMKPSARPVAHIGETFEPNARQASVSIFIPPKA
ncbi:MAG: hypothetical protein PHQ12_07245 [Chthoniobacteraceae bacterium]|nr:hypothetical protein [Chthoniobacteraceae bacterium]